MHECTKKTAYPLSQNGYAASHTTGERIDYIRGKKRKLLHAYIISRSAPGVKRNLKGFENMNKGNIAFDSYIQKLFEIYINNEFEGIQGLQFDDLKVEYNKLNAFGKIHNFSVEDRIYIEDDILSEVTEISERAGFTGGFKVASCWKYSIYSLCKPVF